MSIKITELIEKLQKEMSDYGDLEVKCYRLKNEGGRIKEANADLYVLREEENGTYVMAIVYLDETPEEPENKQPPPQNNEAH